MASASERDLIRAAADRLLAGTPLRSDGALTVVSLATEADVKRHVLTHRHTDLKDEFYARVRAKGRSPPARPGFVTNCPAPAAGWPKHSRKTSGYGQAWKRSPGLRTS